ncbi:MAG: LytTR family DNA-binding domain-containing protein [Nocardioidaceae bacterium]
MLRRDPRVAEVVTAGSAADALRVLQDGGVTAVFTDIAMPGLSGLDLAGVLSRFATPVPVVFVTAHDEHAVEAFSLDAVDYLLKPVRDERLTEAVRRIVEARDRRPDAGEGTGARGLAADSIPVELGGVTRFVARADVLYAEAQGDYARLHTADGRSHLIRTPLTTLEEGWRHAGFVRIHRSLLVALAHVEEVRLDGGRCSVLVAGEELTVSRRHTRELRDLLVRRPRPGTARP